METFDDDEKKIVEGEEGTTTTSTETSGQSKEQSQSGEDWTNDILEEDETSIEVNSKVGVVNSHPESFEASSDNELVAGALPLATLHPKEAIKNVEARYGDDADEDNLDKLRNGETGPVHAGLCSLLDTVQDEQAVHQKVTSGEHRYANELDTKKGILALQAKGPAVAKGKELTGRNSLLMITTHMGVSKLANLPDINSGIRIIYRAPNATEMSALDERLAQHKDELGYYTLGLSHSFADSFSQDILFDFLMEYIVDCNLKDWKVDGVVNVGLLKEVIRKSSLKHHYLAIQAAFYSRGYPLVRVCTSDDISCSNIMRGDVHFQHCYWILEDTLTQDQIRFMTHDMSHKHTKEEVLKYQQSLEYPESSVELVSESGAKLRLEFEVPSVSKDLVLAADWIKATRRVIVDQKRQYNDGMAEQRFIRKQVDTNQLRLFTSWISRIVVVPESGLESEESYVKDPIQIGGVIESLASDDKLINDALTGVWKFMDSATKAVVGVPQHACDKCGSSQEASNLDEAIVPFDPMSVFFMCHCPSIARYQKTIAAMQDLV